MANVIAAENLSTEIIVNQFRDPMRSEAGPNSSDTFTDPNDGSRDSGHPFIVTSEPDTDVIYPIIIIEEAGDARGRIDERVDLNAGRYAVVVTIRAESATTMFDLRDSFRAWFTDRIDTFNDNGFEDPEISSSNRSDWDTEVKTSSMEFTCEGTVNTE